MNETVTFNEGDIFRWCYKDKPSDGAWGVYHCKSQIAVVKNGLLRDTYWCGNYDGAQWSFDEATARLELEFIGNLADLEKRHERNADYYDDADCVNLNHSNSTGGNFYVRKGAKRSANKMLEVARYRQEKALNDARCATERTVRLGQESAKIEAGEPLDRIFL